MKKFTIKVLIFTIYAIFIFILFTLLIVLLPPTHQTSATLLFAEIQKDSLLKNEDSPRIIFIGGSNLSFGLNGQMIKDSLKLNPINTAIHASIGIKYMLENTLQYVREGDIIVFIPEYSHFYKSWDAGSEELLRTVLDVKRENIRLLNLGQIISCVPYSAFKLNIGSYGVSKKFIELTEPCYRANAFDQYGDVYDSLRLVRKKIAPSKIDIKSYNPQVIKEIKTLSRKFQEKGATFMLSYPCFQGTSFQNSEEAIYKVQEAYKSNDFMILGTPKRYKMPDSLMFDTPYHLSKAGSDIRTKLLIEDIDSLGLLKK